MEASAAETSTAAMEATTAPATTVTTAAALGKSRLGQTDHCERCDPCKKSFEQGGFLHIVILHPSAVSAREGTPPLLTLVYLESDFIQEGCPVGQGKQPAGQAQMAAGTGCFSHKGQVMPTWLLPTTYRVP